jgi:hypothetical protein
VLDACSASDRVAVTDSACQAKQTLNLRACRAVTSCDSHGTIQYHATGAPQLPSHATATNKGCFMSERRVMWSRWQHSWHHCRLTAKTLQQVRTATESLVEATQGTDALTTGHDVGHKFCAVAARATSGPCPCNKQRRCLQAVSCTLL